jgi:hypothetical protein
MNGLNLLIPTRRRIGKKMGSCVSGLLPGLKNAEGLRFPAELERSGRRIRLQNEA